MKIGIAYSLAPEKTADVDGPDDRYEEFDRPETVDAIASVIRDDGHDVVLLGDGREFLSKMLSDPPDFVFNIAEGSGVSRNREARVPAVCEMLGVPYSGSDPLTLAATLDKDIARRLVKEGLDEQHGGVGTSVRRAWHVPFGFPLPPNVDPKVVGDFFRHHSKKHETWSFILKPCYEGSSKGIRGQCVVSSAEEAVEAFSRLRSYNQPILFEEFIEGDEVTVGVLGTGPDIRVLGVLGIRPKVADARFVYSLEVKRNWQARVDYDSPAQLNADIVLKLVMAAEFVHKTLSCRDFSRIDFRLRDGVPYFIEANPLPGLAPVTSDLVILAEGYGISHSELIRRILHAALRRVGLMERPK